MRKGIIIIAALITVFLTVGAVGLVVFEFTGNSETGNPENFLDSRNRKEIRERQVIISLSEKPDSIYISWKGTKKGPKFLRVSQSKEDLPKSEAIKAVSEKALKGSYYRYTAELNGLGYGKKYYYEIGDGVMFDSPQSFISPETAGTDSFLYLGDVQFDVSMEEYQRWGEMTEAIYERHPSLRCAVIGGDMVNIPSETAQWNGFLDNCQVFSKLPLMTVSGNHEGVSSNKTYKKLFASPENGPDAEELKEDFYYFDYGNCRFIMTDSSFLTDERREKMGDDTWQAYEEAVEEWLRKTLQQSTKIWNIVVTHHPPYGMHDRDTVSPQLRKLWVPIMEEYNTDLVLCGHQHMYMRTEEINGITYIMGNSGQRKSEVYDGSNAPDYCMAAYGDGMNYQVIEADWRKLQIISYNEKGLIIDETSLEKNLGFHILKFFGGN